MQASASTSTCPAAEHTCRTSAEGLEYRHHVVFATTCLHVRIEGLSVECAGHGLVIHVAQAFDCSIVGITVRCKVGFGCLRRSHFSSSR